VNITCELPERVEQEETPRVLRFEQRHDDRWPMQGAATLFRLGGERFGEMVNLHMEDFSPRGMGATSDTPIEPGAVVSVGFSAPGYPAKRGVVVSCVPCGRGYRVGVLFEARLAA
jgi:hypothetical protein